MKLLLATFFMFLCSINTYSQVEEEHFIGEWYHVKTDRFTKEITLRRTKNNYGISIALKLSLIHI